MLHAFGSDAQNFCASARFGGLASGGVRRGAQRGTAAGLTLSTVICQLWDSNDLQWATKCDPLKLAQ